VIFQDAQSGYYIKPLVLQVNSRHWAYDHIRMGLGR